MAWLFPLAVLLAVLYLVIREQRAAHTHEARQLSVRLHAAGESLKAQRQGQSTNEATAVLCVKRADQQAEAMRLSAAVRATPIVKPKRKRVKKPKLAEVTPMRRIK
jgi:hypothetical protein